MDKPTVRDIAREAGVSLATVDRVLNDRPGVRPATVRRVKDAVAALGYVRDLSAANLARRRRYRFAFVLPAQPSQFLITLKTAIEEAGEGLMPDRPEVRIIEAALTDPLSAVAALQQLETLEADGVAIMAPQTPMVRDIIARLKDRGVVVATLITDQPFSRRDHFIGIDNLAAGRTAGVLMGRFLGPCRGAVAVVVNSLQARDMIERRLGFQQALGERFANLTALPSVEGHDDHAQTARVVETCLATQPGVVGLYCAGAGLRGVTRAMAGRGPGERLVVIGHELTPHAREALDAGRIDAVIAQNTGHLARSALRVLRAQCDGAEIIASQETVRIEIIIKENLPALPPRTAAAPRPAPLDAAAGG